jgi:MATE family multidrug resistance protein
VLGNTMFYFCWLLGSGPTAAVSPMIAHILGATPTNRDDVRGVARMGFWSVLMVARPLWACCGSPQPIFCCSVNRSIWLAGERQFVGDRCRSACPSRSASRCLQELFDGAVEAERVADRHGRSRWSFNALFDYALIFGHFGLPRLGLMATGIASARRSS